MKQEDLLAYWVVKAYDPATKTFSDVFKSYGKNIADDKLVKCLAAGICAVVEFRKLPMI
jgi:hypothetical protein